MTPKEYTQYELQRQEIIRANAGRRLSGRPQLEVPPKLPRPMSVQLTDANGEYVGTWPHGVTVEQARHDATEQGYAGPFRVKHVPAIC